MIHIKQWLGKNVGSKDSHFILLLRITQTRIYDYSVEWAHGEKYNEALFMEIGFWMYGVWAQGEIKRLTLKMENENDVS